VRLQHSRLITSHTGYFHFFLQDNAPLKQLAELRMYGKAGNKPGFDWLLKVSQRSTASLERRCASRRATNATAQPASSISRRRGSVARVVAGWCSGEPLIGGYRLHA
jgi:hypothetical protein